MWLSIDKAGEAQELGHDIEFLTYGQSLPPRALCSSSLRSPQDLLSLFMTNKIWVLSASSLEAGDTIDNIDKDKMFLWSRFHQDYQYNNNHTLKSENSAGEEASAEDTERDSMEEDGEMEQEEEDISEPGQKEDIEADEEDIFTKSLAPENLDLKNFLIVEDRRKKISQISEIIAYNIDKQKQVRMK